MNFKSLKKISISVPLGAEALDPSLANLEDLDLEGLTEVEMTLRRAGAYTSYVFIGSNGNDDAGSVVSSTHSIR